MNNFQPSLAPYVQSPNSHVEAMHLLKKRVNQVQAFHPGQLAGTRWAIGCVSLEVTQRCNLDCSACYLSEDAESIHDIPLEFLLERIRMIFKHYGAGCDIQISGGDPTLRSRDDLIKIVAEIRRLGMRSSLFTNGIKATRELLQSLAQAGLNDVAFHVDITQERKQQGQLFANEAALNDLRKQYIARAQGLGLNIFFNTTVVEANFHEVPMLVDFFAQRTHQVSFISFQMQADTGRGVLGERPAVISQQSMIEKINAGLGAIIDFDVLLPGHSQCNRYATALIAGGRAYDAFAPKKIVQRFFHHSQKMQLNRESTASAIFSALSGMVQSPRAVIAALFWFSFTVWTMRRHWLGLATRTQSLRKLSVLIHNFMDADALDLERTHACVFMAMTADGPMSMCAFNAKRDEFLHKPLKQADGQWFYPVKQKLASNVSTIKFLKGRERQQFLQQRKKATQASASKTASIHI